MRKLLLNTFSLRTFLYCLMRSLCLLCLFSLSSCSFFSDSNVKQVEFDNIAKLAKKHGFKLTQSKDYSFYTVKNIINDSELYFTAIKDCRQKGVSLQSLLRQILVGFTAPVISSQETLTVDNQTVLRSFISANYRNETLNFVIYSVDVSGCVTDYAFWSTAELQPLAKSQAFSQLTSFIVELIQR